MFYIEKDNKIVLFDEERQKLENTITFTPQYAGLPIQETQDGYTVVDFELMTFEEAQVKEAQKERERLDMLFLTGADVERGIYQAKGMDFDDIMAFVMANPPAGLDVKALKIELKANNFYRGNLYVNAVGALLGFTSEQLDKFFTDGNYEHLLPVEEETTEDNSVVDEVTDEDTTDATDSDISI